MFKNHFLPLSFMMLIAFMSCFRATAQMVSAEEIPEFGKTFNVDVNNPSGAIHAYMIESSAPGSILWPGEALTITLQLENKTASEVNLTGSLQVIAYGTRGRAGDVWTPEMFKIADVNEQPVKTVVHEGSYTNLSFSVQIPERFGAYALVTDLGQFGRTFIGSYVRTFSVSPKRIQYPSFCLDDISNDVLQRLDTHAIRMGVEYKPTTDPDFQVWYSKLKERLDTYNKANIAVMLEFGAPAAYGKLLPMGISRPWLTGNGVTMTAKTDMAWLPQYDSDFEKLATKIACDFGWPKGPVDAFDLWNEPWDGVSISGWGADIPRYRAIYIRMAKAVEYARKNAGVDLLAGGTSSTSNAYDKLFADGSDSLLNRFDYCSIHYQGLAPSSTIKKWVNRKSPEGKVKIWDTESWVANTDDRVAAVVATDRSAGYDRAMGIFGGNICRVLRQKVRIGRKDSSTEITQAWSVAAAIGATQHFIGERKFKQFLFRNGLPWVMEFNGQSEGGTENNPEDGTLVVVGDLGDEFGSDHLLFRTVRGLKERAHKERLIQELTRLDSTDTKQRTRIKNELEKDEPLDSASLTLNDSNGKFILFDFYGNKVAAINHLITIPLNSQGFFLRADGSPGSFESLVSAVRKASIKGIEPLEIIPYDFQSSIASHPDLKVKLTNVLNSEVTGKLRLSMKSLMLRDTVLSLDLKANETKWVSTKVLAGQVSAANAYSFHAEFQTSPGKAIHDEILHVNIIPRKTIKVDGDLKDWDGVVPQIIKSENKSENNLTEAAWFPFKQFTKNEGLGLASAYLAYDDQYFYFAAKVADTSVDEGMPRFETRNVNEDFYPEKITVPYNQFRFGGAMMQPGISYSVKWDGIIKPAFKGKYMFTMRSEGELAVWINDSLVFDNRYQLGKDRPVFSAFLKKTGNKIRIEFSKNYGNAGVQLAWQGTGQPPKIIPANSYFHMDKGQLRSGLRAHYFNGPAFNALRIERIDSVLNFSWKDADVPDKAFLKNPMIELDWPKGIRRYSYRNDPSLPSGNFQDHDNVQIAFNVLDSNQKSMYPYPPGTMPGFTTYQCTDYEYALNPVAAKYGGGTEIWRLRSPGMPHKHFFPRQGASPYDGPVKNGKLIIGRIGNTRIVEAAIPWSEIPDVKNKLDKGLPIKFSYRVNDNTPHGTMELSRKRSVAKINPSFMVDWKEHWANELQFSFIK